jgi:hypothetical protein
MEPPKKKRKKDEVVNTQKAKPASKNEISPPVVFFTGVEKPREEQAVREVERPRQLADAGVRNAGQTVAAAPRRKPGDTESMRGSMRSDSKSTCGYS